MMDEEKVMEEKLIVEEEVFEELTDEIPDFISDDDIVVID